MDKNAVEDLVDIIINNEVFKRKPLFTNVKSVTNSCCYGQVIQKLIVWCDAHEEEYNFDLSQTQEKFKQYVGECRKAALNIKNALEIKIFQENKQYGSWFSKLLPLIKSMDSAQPGQSIEPSTNAHKVILMMN